MTKINSARKNYYNGKNIHIVCISYTHARAHTHRDIKIFTLFYVKGERQKQNRENISKLKRAQLKSRYCRKKWELTAVFFRSARVCVCVSAIKKAPQVQFATTTATTNPNSNNPVKQSLINHPIMKRTAMPTELSTFHILCVYQQSTVVRSHTHTNTSIFP